MLLIIRHLLIIAQGDDDHRADGDLELALDKSVQIMEVVYCSNTYIVENTFNDALQALHNRKSKLNADVHVQKAEQVQHEGPSTKLTSTGYTAKF